MPESDAVGPPAAGAPIWEIGVAVYAMPLPPPAAKKDGPPVDGAVQVPVHTLEPDGLVVSVRPPTTLPAICPFVVSDEPMVVDRVPVTSEARATPAMPDPHARRSPRKPTVRIFVVSDVCMSVSCEGY